MSNTALVTGASSGIGRELARYHAAKGGDLILTARRAAELNALKSELEAAHNITVTTIPLDLGTAEGPTALYDAIKSAGLQVDILINNAGFGGHGLHIERDLDAELAMIDLNVKSLVALTHMFAKDMVAQGGGKILNVGSTAGFMPGPKQAIYFATKAFVNSFSQAIDEELRAKGVTSTVLAPGGVETEFMDAADLSDTKMGQQNLASASSVAKVGYEAMLAGDLVAINDGRLKFLLNWVTPLMPRRQMLKQIATAQSKA
ncbi:MAG: SDR family NAD(P)-dependent oxidoreductase [Marinosulfonomonas sp.]